MYRNLSIFGLVLGTIILIPRGVDAFWPFTITSAAGGETPVLHDATLALLTPATNIDPNPNKGEVDLALTLDSALIDTSGPEGAIPDSTVPPAGVQQSSGTITKYTVKSGDTLSGIASRFNVSINTILWANDIKDAKLVKPGATLTILPVSGIQHKVLSGETFSTLAKKYAADSSDIAAFNGLDSEKGLINGATIIIPGGELPALSKNPATKTVTKPDTGSTATKTSIKIKTGGSLASVEPTGDTSTALSGFFTNPLPGGLITQSIHGWNGVDIGAPNGTPVYAAAAGTVIVSKVGGWNGGYGNYVVIDHGNGTQTLYSHLSSDNVSVGETVSEGERLGGVGITGEATGYHLHFEVRGAKNPFAGCAVRSRCSI